MALTESPLLPTTSTRLIEHPDAIGDVFNIGAQDEIMTHLAHQVIAKVGASSTVEHIACDKAYDAGFEDMTRTRLS